MDRPLYIEQSLYNSSSAALQAPPRAMISSHTLLIGILALALSSQACSLLNGPPRAGEILTSADAYEVFGVPMQVTYDSRDKYHKNVSSVTLSGDSDGGRQFELSLSLCFSDSESLRSAERTWRYGKDYPIEPPGLVVISGIGESAWTLPRGTGRDYLVRLSRCYFILSVGGTAYADGPTVNDKLIELTRSLAARLAERNAS